MAIWYTDNIAGDDTTGDGSISTPFKTVNKAVSVASSADEIRVAGSGWTTAPGTVSAISTSSVTLNTTVDLSGIFTAGRVLISVKDPDLGDRKILFKVVGVAGGSINTQVPAGLTPGVNYEIEYITTNYYNSTSTSTTFENLTSVGTTLTDLKIEGGWTNGFTAQDGVTAFIFYSTSSTTASGIGFSLAAGQTGWSFNNFAFAALSTGVGNTASGFDVTIGLGNIWLANCRIFSNNFSNRPINIPGLTTRIYNSTSNAVVWVGSSCPIGSSFTIDELYTVDVGGSTFGQNANGGQGTIQNMYVRTNGSTLAGSGSGGQLYNGSWIVNNLTIGWAGDTTNQNYVLFGDQASGNLTNLSYTGNTTFKAFVLGLPGVTQAEWTTSSNIDSYSFLGSNSYTNQPRSAFSYLFVKDAAGEKLLQAGCNPIFADPTEFDTGTNSLRVKKSVAYKGAIPIKQYYIPAGSTNAITFTIRAKSTGSNDTEFAFQPSPSIAAINSLSAPYILPQSFTLTNAWADYTYTLAAPDVIAMADGYAVFSCVIDPNWSETYVWIDSVTIS